MPNTAHASQETDQKYGEFNSKYIENLEKLMLIRRRNKECLSVIDIPLLVFGCPNFGLRDAFDASFNHSSNKATWDTVGLIPYTRKYLSSHHVRHEVVITKNGTVDLDADPQTALLLQLEAHNKCCCSILSSLGYRGDVCNGIGLSRPFPADPTSVMTVSVT